MLDIDLGGLIQKAKEEAAAKLQAQLDNDRQIREQEEVEKRNHIQFEQDVEYVKTLLDPVGLLERINNEVLNGRGSISQSETTYYYALGWDSVERTDFSSGHVIAFDFQENSGGASSLKINGGHGSEEHFILSQIRDDQQFSEKVQAGLIKAYNNSYWSMSRWEA